MHHPTIKKSLDKLTGARTLPNEARLGKGSCQTFRSSCQTFWGSCQSSELILKQNQHKEKSEAVARVRGSCQSGSCQSSEAVARVKGSCQTPLWCPDLIYFFVKEFCSLAVARVNFMHPEAVARPISDHFSRLSGMSRWSCFALMFWCQNLMMLNYSTL
jgi:hypothetical protein